MENPSFIFTSNPIELKEEGENFYVEGYISTSDLDLVNDIVTKNCLMDMAEQMRSRTIKLDIEHESFIGKSELDMEINKTIIPAAKIEDFLMDKKGLKVRAMLNKHIGRFKEIKNSIKDGFIDAFSIAFVPVKASIQEKNGQEVRMLEKINLLNVAFTGNPINTSATIEKVFMKSLEFLEEKSKPKKRPKPKVSESEYEDDDEDEDEEETKKKKKKTGRGRADESGTKEKKTNNHASDTIKHGRLKNMTEDKKETEEEVEESEPEAEVEAETETKEDVEAEKEVEGKDEHTEEKEEPAENAEVKSLGEEVASLKEQVATLKAQIKLPIKKSVQSTEDKSSNFEDKSLNPLDLIA